MQAGTGRVKRPTVVDVADRAGVSRQTVTRAMNDMTGISVETKARVLQAAKDLKYRPSRFGRGLVVGQQQTLGLVIEDLTNPYFPELAVGVVDAAAAAGWTVVVTDSAHSPGDTAGFFAGLTAQVDAIIGYIRVPPSDYDDVFGDLPVVAFESTPESGSRGVVEIDFAPGLALAVDHLRQTGRKRIVMVDAGTPTEPSGRALHYADAMMARRLQPHTVFEDATPGGAVRAIADVLREVPDVDALIAFNDIQAFGLIKAAQHAGLQVPEQCAVLGMDGLGMGVYSTPELSSLDLDIAQVGRIGVELATQMYSGALPPSGPEVHRLVHHSLLVRESA